MTFPLRCGACRLEILELERQLNPNSPLDRDVARLHNWSWRRHRSRWVPICPTCQEAP